MARVVTIDAFWQQTLAPTLASAGERGAAAFGFHPGAEAVLMFARALGGLESAFHNPKKPFGAIGERLQ